MDPIRGAAQLWQHPACRSGTQQAAEVQRSKDEIEGFFVNENRSENHVTLLHVFDDAEHDKTGYNVHTSGEIALKCNLMPSIYYELSSLSVGTAYCNISANPYNCKQRSLYFSGCVRGYAVMELGIKTSFEKLLY